MRRLGFLVTILAVNDDGVPLTAEFLAPIPDLRYKGACGIEMLAELLRRRIEAAALQRLFDLQSGTESGNEHDILCGNLPLLDAPVTIAVVDETNPTLCEVLIDERIVDDLTQQIDLPVGMSLECGERHVDRPLYAITEAEVARHQHLKLTHSQSRGPKRTLALVLTEVLDALNYRPGVVIGYAVELLEGHGARI